LQAGAIKPMPKSSNDRFKFDVQGGLPGQMCRNQSTSKSAVGTEVHMNSKSSYRIVFAFSLWRHERREPRMIEHAFAEVAWHVYNLFEN
jgi:hypothetical protein